VLRRFALLAVLAAAATTVAGCGGDDSGSPDIAFVSSRDGEYAIFTMSADGKGEQRLTPREGEAPEGESVFWQIDPAWSPDATKIAFVSARTGEAHVYVMSADGTGTSQLTSGKASDTHPTWSPDGSSMAFARSGDIYVMKADGSDPERISDIISCRGGVDLIEPGIDVIAVEAQAPLIPQIASQTPFNSRDPRAAGIANDVSHRPAHQFVSKDLVVPVVSVEDGGIRT